MKVNKKSFQERRTDLEKQESMKTIWTINIIIVVTLMSYGVIVFSLNSGMPLMFVAFVSSALSFLVGAAMYSSLVEPIDKVIAQLNKQEEK
tara:strand:- start:3293 stop:3565 length:273 start_codon:yes stop_codon:yes gene_type:complete